MAKSLGNEGLVKVGSDVIAFIKSYTLEQQANTVEGTVLGDTTKSFAITDSSWNGSFDAFWDLSDTAQGNLTIGASVTLLLQPQGATTGDEQYTGTALITGISVTANNDGYVETSITFQGTGALTQNAVA